MTEQVLKTQFVDTKKIQEVADTLYESYPNLAKQIALAYIRIDKACQLLRLKFTYKGLDYGIMVRGAEPFIRTTEDNSAVVGIDVYLGAVNQYIDKAEQVGNIRILFTSNGMADYITYLYKDIDSNMFRTDDQLLTLVEWLAISRKHFEELVNKAFETTPPAARNAPKPTEVPRLQTSQPKPRQANPSQPSRPPQSPPPSRQETPDEAKVSETGSAAPSPPKEVTPRFDIDAESEVIRVSDDVFKKEEKE